MATNSEVMVGNLFSNIPVLTLGELFEDVIVTDFTRIQRIVSRVSGMTNRKMNWW